MSKLLLGIIEFFAAILLFAILLFLLGSINETVISNLTGKKIIEITHQKASFVLMGLQVAGVFLITLWLFRNKVQSNRWRHHKPFSSKTSKMIIGLALLFILPFYLIPFF
ncbi:hypothetical protein [Gracilibacillus timonensis]|uniref:hypothetical protein n=1 Tax=Gracilibacillus timonensis TaxID=1816696 RepID=UPI000825A974|nr:hypothetical protein [Gracilibacillus timonensis]